MMSSVNRATAIRWTSAIVVLALVALGGVSLSRIIAHESRALCAEIDNTVGLYGGAAVTVMGVKIGTVESIAPAGNHMRVEMKIDDRKIPDSVRAAIINNSIMADRRMELVDAYYQDGPELPAGTCIAQSATTTPIGMSDAFGTLSDFAGRLAAPGPNAVQPLRDVLTRIDAETAGMGSQVNESFSDLAAIMNSPDQFVAHLGELLTSASSLSTSVAGDWPEIQAVVTDLGPLLSSIVTLLRGLASIMESMKIMIHPLDRVLTHWLPQIWPVLDAAVPIVDLVKNRVLDSSEIIAKVPSIIAMLQSAISVDQQALSVVYKPPNVTVSTPDSEMVCAAVNAARPGTCSAARSTVTVPLVSLVLSAVGGRS
jgi:phospholipid/cholesterol/gamma-HCH transport system substrate-binding protein